jgi:hypothetical protein
MLTTPILVGPAPASPDLTSGFAVPNVEGPTNHSSDAMSFHPALHQTIQDPFEVQELFA